MGQFAASARRRTALSVLTAGATLIVGCAAPGATAAPDEPLPLDTATATALVLAPEPATATAVIDVHVDFDAITARVAELEDRIAALGDGPVGDDVETLVADLGQLSDDVGAAGERLRAKVASAADRRRIAELSDRVAGMVDKLQRAMPEVDVRATVDPAIAGLFERLRRARDTLNEFVPIEEPTATPTP